MANTIVEDELWDEFHLLVNMTSRELREWLMTDAAGEDTEALLDEAAPALGRQVLSILAKRRGDVTADDVEAMTAVVRLVRSLRGEDPIEPTSGDDEGWRHALMDVGHDPLKPVDPPRRS